MARPIKETPVLYGKDAIRMLKEVANPKPLPPEVIERVFREGREMEKIHKDSYEEAGIKNKKWI